MFGVVLALLFTKQMTVAQFDKLFPDDHDAEAPEDQKERAAFSVNTGSRWRSPNPKQKYPANEFLCSRDREQEPITMADESAPQKQRTSIKDPMFMIGLVTLIVVCFYTCYAREQVYQTQKANSIATKALTEANHPYVMWTGVSPTRNKDTQGHENWRMGITWTNFGNTPANSSKAYICDPIIRSNDIIPNFECHISEAQDFEYDIGPKQTISLVGPRIDDSDFDATESGGKIHIHIWRNQLH